MKRNSFFAGLLALAIGMASIASVTYSAPAGAASSTRSAQLTQFKKVNSEYLASSILDEFNLPIGMNLTTIYTHTQANVTLANTALSITVQAGKTYLVEAQLYTSANASGGLQINFAGGTATATSFVGLCKLFAGTTTSASTAQTALNTGAGATAALTDIRCTATLVVNAGGTLIIKAAQNASHASDSSILVGSSLTATEL